jgi:hypothetical protein
MVVADLRPPRTGDGAADAGEHGVEFKQALSGFLREHAATG